MRVIYVAPRFHTNQIPIVKGWIKDGDQVLFVSQYTGKSEDYTYCEPVVLGYSLLFNIIERAYSFLHRRELEKSSNPENFKLHYGFPPLREVMKILRNFQPELIVLRERSVYNIIITMLCRIKDIPCILYNQTPLYDSEKPRTDILHRIVNGLTPKQRITPVKGNPSTGYFDENATYIPFVMEPMVSPDEKQYFRDGKIHILCVAKYETRKNILMLMNVIKQLQYRYDIHLTVAGEVSTEHHKEYYHRVLDYVEQEELEEHVTLYVNLRREDVFSLYQQADVYVLPSTGEFASVSQLEAMACSLPVICSDTNGTGCYVKNGENGFLFADNNLEDLKEKVSMLIGKRENIIRMGRNSYNAVVTKYSFENYKKNVLHIMKHLM